MLFRFACKRYRSIDTTAREIEITRAQSAFVSAHADICPRCRAYSIQMDALREALSESNIEPLLVSADFTENIVRGVRAMRRESYRTAYRPVLAGAVAAAVALGAILQIIGGQPEAATTDGTAETSIKRESPLNSTEPGDVNLFDSPSKLVRDPRPYDV